MNDQPPLRYDPIARGLHWVMALLVLGMVGLGFYAANLNPNDPFSQRAFFWHRSFGMLVLLLAIIRIAWRYHHPSPPAPDYLPVWEKRDALRIQLALYALMIVIPITGYLISTADGNGVNFFGLFEIPALLDVDKGRATTLSPVHFGTALVFISLAALHIMAALKHHYLDRDGLLSRMW
ncbi:MAG: cytochrome b [Magnetococcus sp. YQC-9]